MTKRNIIFISILLILAAVVIKILLKDSNTNLDKEWIGFFSGLLFGAGIVLPLSLILKKNRK